MGARKEENTRFQDNLLTRDIDFHRGCVHVSMGAHSSYGVLSPGVCPKDWVSPK